MEIIGSIVIYIIMACAIASCLCSVFRPKHPFGKEFIAGIDSIGPIFLPVAGILASAPYIKAFVGSVFGPIFGVIGADPSMAATTFIAVDMGGYQLAYDLAQTKESWIMSMVTGYMAGATLVFTIPVSLKILLPNDRKYMALGIMSGLIAIPVGVFTSTLIMYFSQPSIREIISTNAYLTYQLNFQWVMILLNLVPLVVVCVLLALGLKLIPNGMIKGFSIFGKILEGTLKIVFVLVVVEYFTGLWSKLFGSFGFDPIIADEEEIFRALETAGAIGIMLCGAFPMVWLIKKYLQKPLAWFGKKVHLSAGATTGILASTANVLASLAMIKDLKPADKVIVIAFGVCCAFLLGDHLSFTANFQPALIVPVMLGKLVGGIFSVFFAKLLAVKTAERLSN